MIARLKKRFILIAMLSVFLVLGLLMLAINLVNYRGVLKNADALLDVLAENGGAFPQAGPMPEDAPWMNEDFREKQELPEDQELPEEQENGPAGRSREEMPGAPDWKGDMGDFRKNGRFNEETPFESRYFSVTLDEEGETLSVDIRNIAAVDEETAVSYAASVINAGKTRGSLGEYRYILVETEESTQVIFLDIGRNLNSFVSFLRVSLLISAVGCAFVFLLILLFSSWILRPVAESYARQKQFITDASHELKTPLTVIDANTEVLEMMGEENEWTQSIHHQVNRLRKMTERLVALSRMNEENRKPERVEFSLSDAVEETVDGFLVAAERKELDIQQKVESGISFSGDERAVRELVSILMDNALKYADPPGPVNVSLARKGLKAELVVENAAKDMKQGNHAELLERFSRADSSRNSETGGFGIGLSMARAIVLEHKGSITVESPKDGQFRVRVTI